MCKRCGHYLPALLDMLLLIPDVCSPQGNVKVVVTITSDVNLRLHGALLPDCERDTVLSAVPDVPDMPDMPEALVIQQSRVFSFLEGESSLLDLLPHMTEATLCPPTANIT